MTQYLLSVHHSPSGPALSDAALRDAYAQVDAFNEDLRAAGSWVFAGGLEGPDTATVVDATGHDLLVTDGPYAEAKEHLGGFWIVEAADLDAALAIAGRGSAACKLPVEVRPFAPEPPTP